LAAICLGVVGLILAGGFVQDIFVQLGEALIHSQTGHLQISRKGYHEGRTLSPDHYLIEQMANFNRERIPERQPHAKGGGAFGHFKVTSDVSASTGSANARTAPLASRLAFAPRRLRSHNVSSVLRAAVPVAGIGR
jgi:hypothetical protein